MPTCLIIEDEHAASEHLKTLLRRLKPELEVLATIGSISDGLMWFSCHADPDLIISDIQIADGLSFQLFSTVQPRSPVVFTTAYDQYAIRAFKLNSIDYLLKPIDEQALGYSLKKFEEQQLWNISRLNGLIESMKLTQPTYRKSFLVHYQGKLLPVVTSEVMAACIENGVVYLLLPGSKRFATDLNLDDLHQQLDPAQFYRVNRQFVVSRHAIREMAVHFNGRLLLQLNIPTPKAVMVSKERVTLFKQWIEGSW